MPCGGDKADPALVARYDALGKLPANAFGKALWDFDKANGYSFPGDPGALNAIFANPRAGHILPVIFNGHLGVKFNDVATPAKGALDPDEFWHAWKRGRDMTVDLFAPDWSAWDWVECDLDELRRDWNVTPPGRSG
jgi:hypothetical protein